MCENISFKVRNTDEDIQYPEENRDLSTMPDNTERIAITVTPEASKTNKVSTWVWAILVLFLDILPGNWLRQLLLYGFKKVSTPL